ncbi:hypothetical protein [Calothrix sp. NIES-3974]|nr:hypothetical protein [Calothrix sp. NIES-3974]
MLKIFVDLSDQHTGEGDISRLQVNVVHHLNLSRRFYQLVDEYLKLQQHK